ncbi:LysR family transcriptional regulator [Pseudoduganella lutea]|uniref:LysR family transcriptional regulator n=1 Tax=Pseudoduganella lutea TaxID=321985 RepID=A0A4P6KSN3_9BURK|nr:LysR family transcriptional regulator [Pseudoduganella lutea]QBE61880.1 LysR family transcriptional regulator [Pseudoduganella lutea]
MTDPGSQRLVRAHLKMRHLVLLVALGKHGSIMGAAHAANLTQPAASRLLRELAELARQSWILPPAGSILRKRLATLFLSKGLEPPADTVESTALPLIANLVAGSDMVVALPRELMQPYLDNGSMVVAPFDLGIGKGIYGLITRRGHRLSPGAKAMLEALREVAARRYRA